MSTELGAQQHEYKVSEEERTTGRLALPAMALGVVAGLYWTFGAGGGFQGMFVALLAVSFLALFWARKRALQNLRLVLFEKGFLFTEGSEHIEARWDEVASFSYQHPGQALGTSVGQGIVQLGLKDGRGIILNHTLGALPDAAERLKNALAPFLKTSGGTS
jgi:hypothetical protein